MITMITYYNLLYHVRNYDYLLSFLYFYKEKRKTFVK